MTAAEVIQTLRLSPHPEGGHYREIFRDPPPAPGGRGRATSIYYLLAAGEVSHWHRVDAVEIWHHHAGGGIELSVARPSGEVQVHRLGADLATGQRPQVVVPAGCWQSARPLGDAWSLVGCTVTPAFEFDGFELAAPDWAPGSGG